MQIKNLLSLFIKQKGYSDEWEQLQKEIDEFADIVGVKKARLNRDIEKTIDFCTSAEVQEALEQNQPIVALESTLITHGMPYP